MTTAQTALRERLAQSLVRSIERHSPWEELAEFTRQSYLTQADKLLDDGWQIGQQPRLDPALRERIDDAVTDYGASERLSLRDQTSTAFQQVRDFHRHKLMALIDSLAPAAQPLPTRSQVRDVLDEHATRFVGQATPFIEDAMIEAGYAREDEPEPQVGKVAYTPEAERLGEAVWDSYSYVTNTPVLWDELDSIEKEKWAYVGQYMIDNHALALAKSVRNTNDGV